MFLEEEKIEKFRKKTQIWFFDLILNIYFFEKYSPDRAETLGKELSHKTLSVSDFLAQSEQCSPPYEVET